MVKKLFLISTFLALTVVLSACLPLSGSGNSSFFPTPTPTKTTGSGRYCLTKEELESIKSQPIAFHCNRTDLGGTTIIEENVPYVLAATDAKVKRIFIKEEKQLILKENCGGVDYYTWKCHPPSWGSVYANSLWKLKDVDPNRKPLKDGDQFDVYLRQDTPDTAKFVCKDGGAKSATTDAYTSLMAEILADSPIKDKIINIEGKSALWYMRSDVIKTDIEIAPPRKKIDEITLDETTYDVFVNLLIAFSPDEDKNFYLVEKGLLPEGNENLPETIIYDQFAILTEVKPKGLSLQLGTFNPVLPGKPWYDIYLPESKPVIYLYPEKPTKLIVKIEPQDGYLTVSDPPYDPETGWEIIAYPDGKIQHLAGPRRAGTSEVEEYPYLYYESEVKGYEIPEEGFVVAKNKLGNLFKEVLPKLGLNTNEAADFSEYWLGRFDEIKKPYVFVTFIPTEQIDRVDPISIFLPNPSGAQHYLPDTKIRVRAYFKPLEKLIDIKPQTLPDLKQRKGFIMSEWGGILDE